MRRGKGNPIPEESRRTVEARERYRCIRCSGPMSDVHHRRRRAVRDEFTHHPVNMVGLCRPCHAWVHANPERARSEGLIVSNWVSDPSTVPVSTPYGSVWLTVDGTRAPVTGPNAPGEGSSLPEGERTAHPGTRIGVDGEEAL